jgi:hypothetical protein
MRLELELQYAEFHPDQVEKVGQVDLGQALKVIHSYPWDREFEKIEERTKEDLTSSVPNVSIRNGDKEILIVSARDKNKFIIEFLTPTHRGEQIIPINSFDYKQRLTTEDFVTKFYDGTIKKTLELKPITPTATNNIGVYKLTEYPLFISGFIFGILALILIFDFWTNGFTSKALPAVYFVGLIILMIGSLAIVTVQYIVYDWGKEVSFENEALIIKQKGKEVKIKKSEIEQIAVIENDGSRYLRYYKYARIKTKDGKAFIVTSFIMEPMDIVNKLKVNHKEESVFFLPIINLDIQSEKEKEKIKRVREKKKIDFLENFKDYEDSKLRQIIRDKKSYADYAVEAATEILERRK